MWRETIETGIFARRHFCSEIIVAEQTLPPTQERDWYGQGGICVRPCVAGLFRVSFRRNSGGAGKRRAGRLRSLRDRGHMNDADRRPFNRPIWAARVRTRTAQRLRVLARKSSARTHGAHITNAFATGRIFDVIEMDAASHNSVDDIRQINDAIRYAPVSARYKVYILDEVHMLSGAAFNALLKTLEEPPPHAKFIFATTEIRKVPITILSRCQRFDLRRLDAERLMAHLETIAAREQVTAEPDALALIARAADGSVRDALSLFDQAIAHAAGPVRAENVQEMLGLADKARVIDLFERLMQGDIAGALNELRDQYGSGADPLIVLNDLAEFTHFVTRVKAVPAVAEDRSLPEAERVRGRALAAALSMRTLSRTWQMLFKGLAEVDEAAKPIAAAEMVLVRIAYAADLPTPDEVIRALSKETAGAGAEASPPRERAQAPGGGSQASRAELAAPERGTARAAAAARRGACA